jgi:hypothetical protein
VCPSVVIIINIFRRFTQEAVYKAATVGDELLVGEDAKAKRSKQEEESQLGDF